MGHGGVSVPHVAIINELKMVEAAGAVLFLSF
jgi:hypothetical protein